MGNQQPLERNQWGQRAVLVVEQALDRGSRALEQNLRNFCLPGSGASHETAGDGRGHDAGVDAGL